MTFRLVDNGRSNP